MLKLDIDGYNRLIKEGYSDSIDQIDFIVYKREFDAGKIKFLLNIPKDSFIYAQIYIKQNMDAVNYSCAGNEFNLKKFQSECKTSTQLNENYKCEYIDGMEDKPMKIFKFLNQSIGGWLKFKYREILKPTYIEFIQPSNYVEMIKKIKL